MSAAISNFNVPSASPADHSAAQAVKFPDTKKPPSATDLLANWEPLAKTTSNFTISSFPFNQTALGEKGRQKLDEIVKSTRGMQSYHITIVGHADSQTQVESANWTVSENRAKTAKDYLVSQGLSAERIYTEGAGATQPIASNDTPEGRAQNRRVEIKLVGTPR